MIKEIFNSITPENIKNIPLIQDAMEIFIDVINENGKISIDIGDIYLKENEIINEEFVKIYLNDFYTYFNKATKSPVIQARIDKINEAYGENYITKVFVDDVAKIFTNEHFISAKSFKQRKGTASAIEHTYKIVESLSTAPVEPTEFKLNPISPFNFSVEGALFKEYYDQLVKPISHPLGFTYDYTQVIGTSFSDTFRLNRTYSNVVVEVRCLLANGTTNTTPYVGADVVDIFNGNEVGRYTTRVTFSDGTYLKRTLNPDSIVYYNADNTVNLEFTGHCSLYLTYDEAVNTLTTDAVEFEIETQFTDSFTETNIPFLIGNDFLIGGDNLEIGDWVKTGIFDSINIDMITV